MHDGHAADRQRQAIRVFEHLVRRRRAVLSTQCLTEFFNGVTRRIQDPIPVSEAAERLDRLANATVVHPLTLDVVTDAVNAVTKHQMAIWDALIWAVAFRNNIPVILTEDKQSRPIINGVRCVNPFDPDFDIESL
jgi:predicted nucleic acid-binding protein